MRRELFLKQRDINQCTHFEDQIKAEIEKQHHISKNY